MFLKQANSQGCSCRNPSHAAGPEQQPIYSSYPSRLSRSLWCEEQQAEGKKKSADETTDPGSGELDAASPAQTSGGIKRLRRRRRRHSPALEWSRRGYSSRGVKEKRRERRWPKPLGPLVEFLIQESLAHLWPKNNSLFEERILLGPYKNPFGSTKKMEILFSKKKGNSTV